MSVRVVQYPTTEIVTLEEAKAWARVTISEDDALISTLIRAMREYAESITGRAFTSRQLELRMDAFPEGAIELPYAPLVSVDYITYVDGDGEHTLSGSPSQYQVDTASEPGRVWTLDGSSWPGTKGDTLDAVRIGFTCGYQSMQAVPVKARLWMQARLATYYEYREQLLADNGRSLPRDFVDGLLDDLIVRRRFA